MVGSYETDRLPIFGELFVMRFYHWQGLCIKWLPNSVFYTCQTQAYWKSVFIRRYFLHEAKDVVGENKRKRFAFMVIGNCTWRKLGLFVSGIQHLSQPLASCPFLQPNNETPRALLRQKSYIFIYSYCRDQGALSLRYNLKKA